MLKEKVREKPKKPIPLVTIAFVQTSVKWYKSDLNFLEINESLKEIFNCQAITAFRRNKISKS